MIQRAIFLAVTIIATGCVVGESDQTDETGDGATTEFDDAQATSSQVDDVITTRLTSPDGATVFATATWRASDGTGEVLIGDVRSTIPSSDLAEMTLADANELTHQFWSNQRSDGDTAYSCTWYSQRGSCCHISVCCQWVAGTYPSYGYQQCTVQSTCGSFPGYLCV